MNNIHRQLRTLDPVRLGELEAVSADPVFDELLEDIMASPSGPLAELIVPGEADLERLEPIVLGRHVPSGLPTPTRRHHRGRRRRARGRGWARCATSWPLEALGLEQGNNGSPDHDRSGRRAQVAARRRYHTGVADGVGDGIRARSVPRRVRRRRRVTPTTFSQATRVPTATSRSLMTAATAGSSRPCRSPCPTPPHSPA